MLLSSVYEVFVLSNSGGSPASALRLHGVLRMKSINPSRSKEVRLRKLAIADLFYARHNPKNFGFCSRLSKTLMDLRLQTGME
ncbi:MAG: hypothetical protein GX416_10605 [Bacteroidales bacterium]|nr:hypothetical protein [Bacteroidales bacterium]